MKKEAEEKLAAEAEAKKVAELARIRIAEEARKAAETLKAAKEK